LREAKVAHLSVAVPFTFGEWQLISAAKRHAKRLKGGAYTPPAKPRGHAITVSGSTRARPLSAFLQRWGEDSAPSGNEPPTCVATL